MFRLSIGLLPVSRTSFGRLSIHLIPLATDAAQGVRPSEAQGTYVDWNKHLHTSARSFHEKHPDASILMFSSWETFTRVLDDPVTYGFSTTDVSKSGGRIWMDFLHPTTKMHGIIAEDMWKFLNEIPACGAEAS